MRAGLIVLTVWLAGCGAAAQFGKMSVLFDVLAARYGGQGPAGLGLLVSVVGFVGLIFGTTAGLIVLRTGPRRALLAALVLGALASAVEAGLPPYPVMIGLRVLEGVSHLAIVVVGPTLIAALAPPRAMGFAMTLWSSFFGVTYAVLALIAPPVLAAGGAAALFFGHAAWMAGCAVVLALLLPPDPPAPPRVAGAGILAQHLIIYASPRIAAPALGFVFYTALYVAVLTLLPPLLMPEWRGPVAAGMPIVSIAVSLTIGVWLLPIMGPVRLVQLGYALGLSAALGFQVSLGAPVAMAVAAFALAAAMGLVQGASFATIPALNIDPGDRARAAGAVAQMGNVGTTSGTPLLALILVALGPSGIAAFTVPLCLAGIAMHAWQTRRRG